ncbi:hypothetical protein BGW36DRAFT_412083 [Talaromyces proteolyticus]|uniref:Uncharacterized protein n=1 Tax=Talaromyces proteolyticus TaxID=1131652 RepID=A0AAD4KK34_9EURO|nr:uncharacterized protein BGW36DRAFT_412083 [Talaromyces proteolyticus]KAH8690271.1 hypothetical protein BGW36DRAFT_412083 [Talaromyces proteolyticus]
MEKDINRPEEATSSPSGTYLPYDQQTYSTEFSTLEVVHHSDLEPYKRASQAGHPTFWQNKDSQYPMYGPATSEPGFSTSISAAHPQTPPQTFICGLPKRTFWIIFAAVVGVCLVAIIVGGAVGGTHHQSSNVAAANSQASSSDQAALQGPTTAFVTVTVGPTSTVSPSLTTTSATKTTSVCVGGTGVGNYVGLCAFACSYDYCPPGPCTCTSSGIPVPTPPTTGVDGVPLSGEDDSYLGLCSYCCNHGYCPSSACKTKAA